MADHNSLQKTWLSTNSKKEPTGRKYKGTFKDISLNWADKDFIDKFDYVCIKMSICRSKLMEDLFHHGGITALIENPHKVVKSMKNDACNKYEPF